MSAEPNASRSADRDTAREPSAPLAQEIATAIDTAAFAALEKSVGSTTLSEILKSYIETAEQLCAVLEAVMRGKP